MLDSTIPRYFIVLPFVFYGIKMLDIEPRVLFSVQIAWGRNANVKLRRHLHRYRLDWSRLKKIRSTQLLAWPDWKHQKSV